MPAFVDWNSLLFGSSPELESHQQVASHPEPDASIPDDSEAWSPVPEVPEVPEALGPESRESEGVALIPELGKPESVVSEHTVLESLVSRSSIPGNAVFRSASHWNAASQAANVRLSFGGIFLATILIWFWLGRRKRSYAHSKRLIGQEENLESVKREFAQRTEALERQFDEALKRKVEDLEEQFQKVVDEQVENVEEHVRKSFNKRVEELEVRIKLDQQALDDVHRALSERMEAFEGYVRTIDAKQLDQEANSIAQRTLGQRLDAVEESCRNVDTKARASAQRIEAIDDSVRVIDTRAKALSQRIEAAEDNLNTTEGQVTLLSHDVNRGSSVIEKLQRQVKSR
jgi:methyl-accepting chemotaxis protein